MENLLLLQSNEQLNYKKNHLFDEDREIVYKINKFTINVQLTRGALKIYNGRKYLKRYIHLPR